MAEPEKPILDRLNDTFKQGLNVSQFLKTMRRNLQADVNRKLREVRDTAFTDGSQLPDFAQVSINEETMNLYVNGFLRGPGNRPIPIAHVSLHLAPSGKTNIEGALHGKSNTNEGDFVRYFLQVTEEGGKLVKPADEEWNFPIREKYMTMKKEAELFFVQIVFDILNQYLADFFELPAAAAPAPAPAPPRAEEVPAPAGAAAALAVVPNPPPPPPVPALRNLTEEEKPLVNALNEFFSFYDVGLENKFFLFDIIPETFLLPYEEASNLLELNLTNLKSFIQSNTNSITRFKRNVSLMEKQHVPSAPMARRIRRFYYVIRYLNDTNEYYNLLLGLYIKALVEVKKLKKKMNINDLSYLLPYIPPINLERMAPMGIIPDGLLREAYELSSKHNIIIFLASVNKFVFPHWVNDYIQNFLEFEIKILNYLTTKKEEAFFLRQLDKLQNEKALEIEELKKQESKIASQKEKTLDPKQKAKDLRDLQGKLEKLEKDRNKLVQKIAKLDEEIDVMKQNLIKSIEEIKQFKGEYTQMLNIIVAMREIKDRFFSRFEYPPDFESIDEQVGSMSGGGSRRHRRSTRRGRRATGKRKTRGH